MSFSFYKAIILNDEIKKKDDDHIDEKNVDFKRLYDFEIVFLEVYKLLLSLLKGSRSSRSSKRINDFDF